MEVPTVTSVDDDSRSRYRKDNSECGPESTIKYDLAGSFYDIQVSKPIMQLDVEASVLKIKKRY